MGGASSKASRSLPKSSTSVARPTGGAATSSRPPAAATAQANPRSSRPPQDHLSHQSPLDTASKIGQTGREASPLNIGKGQQQVDDGSVGPVVERSQGGSETKDDREWPAVCVASLPTWLLLTVDSLHSAGIRRDAFDPDFVSQLNSLGPVNVPPAPWQSPNASRPGSPANTASSPNQPTPQQPSQRRPPSQMMRILQARQAREQETSEGQSSTTTQQTTDPNHLDAPTLTALLDEIKSAKSKADIDSIAVSYDFNTSTLARLTKRFNSPSVGEPVDPEEAKFDLERDSGKPPRIYAVWKESSVQM